MTEHPQLVCPGEMIEEEMEERGWTQLDLAKHTNIIPEAIYGVIAGTWRITPTMAESFTKAFGTSEEVWINLEANYQRAKRKGGG